MTTFVTPLRGTLSRDLDTISHSMRGILDNRDPSWKQLSSPAYPALNVSFDEKQVRVWMFLPGLNKEDIDISMIQNHLTIAGKRHIEYPDEARIQQDERFQGRFQRIVTLPKDVDREDVKASYNDGVLRLCLGRKQPSKTRVEIE